jgi:hypothetical protein
MSYQASPKQIPIGQWWTNPGRQIAVATKFCTEHVARIGERRGTYRALVGKPGGRTPLGRPRRRWEDNIKMDLREVGGSVAWIDVAQDRDRWRVFVYTVMNHRVS